MILARNGLSFLVVLLCLTSLSCTKETTVLESGPAFVSFSYGITAGTQTVGAPVAAMVPKGLKGAWADFVVSPALPTGLALDPRTGILSGMPSMVWPETLFTVIAYLGKKSAYAEFTLQVLPTPPGGVVYASNPVAYTVGVAIPPNAPFSFGGPIVSYAVTPALPAGLTLDATTGIISGTPALVSAQAAYAVVATNESGSFTATVAIAVNPPPPVNLVYGVNPATYLLGSSIPTNAPTSQGGAVVSYSVSPTLPAGLVFSTTTGAITGTPSAITARANYVVTATNLGGATTASISIAINPQAPTLLNYPFNPATYQHGTLIGTNTPSHSGGAVASYSVVPALPAGLAWNSTTGAISGTPNAAAAENNYVVTASNVTGSTSVVLVLTVNPKPPTALTYAFPSGVYTMGTTIAPNSPSYSGGPISSYAVTPNLPPGLIFNNLTGVISGQPNALSAQADYVVTGSNVSGSTTATISIRVVAVPPSNLTYTVNPATYVVGSAIGANSPASAGGAVVSYLISPSLPAGLQFDLTSGVITGTPSVVAAQANYTVTAVNTGGQTTASLSVRVNPPAPTITSVTPAFGPDTGNTTITVTGQNFGGASVTLGGSQCGSLILLNGGTQLTCVTPARPPGATVLSLTTGGGTATANFQYIATPTISSVTPDAAPLAGGTVITVNGNYLLGTTTKVDGLDCSPLVIVSDTVIHCTVPAHAAGFFNLTVTSAVGSASRPLLYLAPPSIAIVNPGYLYAGSSTTFMITGTDFYNPTFKVGGVDCIDVVPSGGNTRWCTLPGTHYGDKVLRVTTEGGFFEQAVHIAATRPRVQPTLLWTGSELIVWGGRTEQAEGSGNDVWSGAIYNPTTGWRAISIPQGIIVGYSAVWSGTQMITWGGGRSYSNYGAAYNPATNVWTQLPVAPLQGRYRQSVAWSGTEMLVWGGWANYVCADGARYNPATNTWNPVSGGPSGLYSAYLTWNGSRFVLGGGVNSSLTVPRATYLYDPVGNAWTTLNDWPSTNYSRPQMGNVDDKLVLFDWNSSTLSYSDLPTLTLSTNTWATASTTNVPPFTYNFYGSGFERVIRSGNSLFVGGTNNSGNAFAFYDPAAQNWTGITSSGVTLDTNYYSLESGGGGIYLWGGTKLVGGAMQTQNTGYRYDISAGTWTQMTAP